MVRTSAKRNQGLRKCSDARNIKTPASKLQTCKECPNAPTIQRTMSRYNWDMMKSRQQALADIFNKMPRTTDDAAAYVAAYAADTKSTATSDVNTESTATFGDDANTNANTNADTDADNVLQHLLKVTDAAYQSIQEPDIKDEFKRQLEQAAITVNNTIPGLTFFLEVFFLTTGREGEGVA